MPESVSEIKKQLPVALIGEIYWWEIDRRRSVGELKMLRESGMKNKKGALLAPFFVYIGMFKTVKAYRNENLSVRLLHV